MTAPTSDSPQPSLRDEALKLMRYANTLTPYKLQDPLDPIVTGALDDWCDRLLLLLASAKLEKKTLETDLPLDADEDGDKFCVECGQWEFEGKLDCKCVGYNQGAAAQYAAIWRALGVKE